MKLYDARRERAKERLKAQLEKGTKTEKVSQLTLATTGANQIPLTKEDITRIKKELVALDGKPRKKGATKKKQEGEVTEEKDKWFIDIYSISMSYVRNSERRKNKGKSKKKMKKVKNTAFVKSVVARPGLITQYKDGKMGISPKTHVFKMRKEEISIN